MTAQTPLQLNRSIAIKFIPLAGALFMEMQIIKGQLRPPPVPAEIIICIINLYQSH